MSEMPETDPRNAEIVHVFAVDLPMPEAARLAGDGARLSEALGGIEVEPDRAEALDTSVLGDFGLSGYLVEGEGVSADAILADESRLDAVRGPVVVLRPRAVTAEPAARAPLSHLGSWPLERARPIGEPIRAASAEGLQTGLPPSRWRGAARAGGRARSWR